MPISFLSYYKWTTLFSGEFIFLDIKVGPEPTPESEGESIIT